MGATRVKDNIGVGNGLSDGQVHWANRKPEVQRWSMKC